MAKRTEVCYTSITMPQAITKNTITGDIIHHWQVDEYDKHERGTWWYVLIIPLTIALIIYGLFSQNFLFSLIIILFSIILFLQAHQHPQKIDFAITDLGVVVGNRLYTFSEFSEFFLIYQPPFVKTLYLETKSAFRPILRIPLNEENPLDIRNTLTEFLDENLEKEEEPLTATSVRNWKLH